MSDPPLPSNEESQPQVQQGNPISDPSSPDDELPETNSVRLEAVDVQSSFFSKENISYPGAYLRLTPLPLTSLSTHEHSTQELRMHIAAIIRETRQLASRISSEHGWQRTGTKNFSSVTAPIENWKTEVSRDTIIAANRDTSDLRDWMAYAGDTEYWFARKSVHRDAAEKGTASWEEFVQGLRDEHSEHERAYTPSVYDARLVLDFGKALEGIESTIVTGGLTMKIYEMCHDVPLRNRVFASLVLTASVSENQFIVAQFPVQLKGTEIGFYSNGKNQDPGNKELSAEMRKKVTIGQYVSIERCIRRPETQEVEWLMATASDAKGGIPMMLQRPAIPGTIAKDVEYFMNWVAGRRKGDS